MIQAKVYEYFKEKNSIELLVVADKNEAREATEVLDYLGYATFVLPDFRAKFGDDLRAFYDELVTISKELSSYYESSAAKKILISPIETILHKLPAKKHLKKLELKFGDEINLDELKEEFLHFGYEFVDIVEAKGEVSFRGEVIDIFATNQNRPIRILLDDTLIESIREFDEESQLSNKDELESINIAPFIAALDKNEFEHIEQKIQSIESSALIADFASLGFWAIDDFVRYGDIFKTALLTSSYKDSFDNEIDLSIFKEASLINEPKIYKDLIATFSKDFMQLNQNKQITILARNNSLFVANECYSYKNCTLKHSTAILNIYSDSEVIISLNKPLPKRAKKRATIVLDELRPGDYVVHEDHGIGKFNGLELIKVMGVKREFVAILYQNDDKLLLPVQNLNKIDRYIASSGVAMLDKLGKTTFMKIKEKVREKLFAIASKIIAMAAQRELIEAKKITIPTKELGEFRQAAGFTYTKDQEEAIFEILKDLESGKVMDRLLSGDVGFGKTEVAMNAILSVIKSGYLVLFFVPTTILSSQHYKTLKERLSPFGVVVFKLDRFTTTKEKNELKNAISNNTPLVCVGTHSLLGLGAFNVGLIIIDEEHKFGVKQKEKLKELSKNSHLLSMSATPIPRSLNMALSKIKGYSTLLTPPKDRLDIKTYVKEKDDVLIKEVILRELRRGGQIFYVYNHIAGIEGVKKWLNDLIPFLKIVVLHSQIDSKTTEDELNKFINGQYNLMLCTSIVESGIHMPNVNTIIIENSNKFGIADLHQLRGRVGRGARQGYCYYLIENKNSLTKEALKRLVALESNSSLGSGAVLAYHDLEIRGGGNLIGEAQSGHIEAIGYSLYLRMLEEEINKLLSKETSKSDVDIKLEIAAYLNSDYIPYDRIRLELYRRLSRCKSASEVYEISSEMEDRFGKLDIFTKQFLNLIIIKILANELNFKSITSYKENILLIDSSDKKIQLKASSSDDDDVVVKILEYLRGKKQ